MVKTPPAPLFRGGEGTRKRKSDRASARFFYTYIHFGLIDADPDDNKFVDCAVAADAEYIVTNDSHFNVLKHIDWPKITVIAIKEFLLQLDNDN